MTQAKYHISLIYYVIKRNVGRLGAFNIDFDEAFSAGLVGLATAIHDYDEVTCPVEFYKFAYHKIWNAIFSSKRGRNLIRTGLLRIKQVFFQRTGRHLNDEQLVSLLGADKKFPKLLRDHLRETGSFVSYAYDDDREDIWADKNVPLPEEALNKQMLVETIAEEVEKLPDDQRKVIKLYYGIGVGALKGFSLQKIAKILHQGQRLVGIAFKEGLTTLMENPRLRVLGETEGCFVRDKNTVQISAGWRT